MGELLSILFYPVLLGSILLAAWGIKKRSSKIMLASSAFTFACSMVAMFSIGPVLLILPIAFLIMGIVFYINSKKHPVR